MPEFLSVVVREIPFSGQEVGNDVGEFVDFLVGLQHARKNESDQ